MNSSEVEVEVEAKVAVANWKIDVAKPTLWKAPSSIASLVNSLRPATLHAHPNQQHKASHPMLFAIPCQSHTRPHSPRSMHRHTSSSNSETRSEFLKPV